MKARTCVPSFEPALESIRRHTEPLPATSPKACLARGNLQHRYHSHKSRGHQGSSFHRKLCASLRPRRHSRLLDLAINVPDTVCLNLFQAFVLCALAPLSPRQPSARDGPSGSGRAAEEKDLVRVRATFPSQPIGHTPGTTNLHDPGL